MQARAPLSSSHNTIVATADAAGAADAAANAANAAAAAAHGGLGLCMEIEYTRLKFKHYLERARTIAQADSSPVAEDEQGGPSLVDDE